jgi:urease beta subunit
MSPVVQRSAVRVEPGVKKGVKVVEPPLKRAAL